MKIISDLAADLAAILGVSPSADKLRAVELIIKNLWNCTGEAEYTSFFCSVIHQILKDDGEPIPFDQLFELVDAVRAARAADIAARKAEFAERIAALRARARA